MQHAVELLLDLELVPVGRDRGDERSGVGWIVPVGLDQAVGDRKARGRAELRLELCRPGLEVAEVAHEPRPPRLRERRLLLVAGQDRHVLDALADEQILQLGVLLEVHPPAAELHVIERWHGDEHVASLEELGHRPVEEREHERADVRAVHVGVGHHDHAAVPQVGDVELVAETGSDRGDHRLDLGVREHLVDAVLLGVDDLPAQRQDRLRHAVARLFRRAAGRVALDDEELRQVGILDRAVGELARKRRVLERALATRELARLPSGLAGVAGGNGLLDDLPSLGALLLEELRELLVHHSLDEAGDARVAQLRLRLPFELGVAQLDRDDGGKTFAGVLALEVVVLLLQEALLARVLVERARQRGTEALEVGSAF